MLKSNSKNNSKYWAKRCDFYRTLRKNHRFIFNAVNFFSKLKYKYGRFTRNGFVQTIKNSIFPWRDTEHWLENETVSMDVENLTKEECKKFKMAGFKKRKSSNGGEEYFADNLMSNGKGSLEICRILGNLWNRTISGGKINTRNGG
jgi:hypothetical protein